MQRKNGLLEIYRVSIYNMSMIKILARLLAMRTMRGLFFRRKFHGQKLKKHLSIDGQIAKMKDRGLVIEDEEYAKTVLERISYYRLTGYLHDFRKPKSDEYVDGISFNTIVSLYEFDTRLTRLLMFALEDIEETFKTRFAYVLSSAFPNDPQIYTRKKIYRDEEELKKSRRMISSAKKNNRSLPFIKHHIENYDGKLPIWVAVEIMTMGTIRALYNNLQRPYQKKIAKKYNTSSVILQNWIENITYTRNHLAHYMRIYNYNFGRIPSSCNNHPTQVVYRGRIFDQIMVMKFLYSDTKEWNEYVVPQLNILMNDYRDVIDLRCLGFPEDWESLIIK